MTTWKNKTWFITGASKGFGRSFAEVILERGGRVVATARDVSTLQDIVDASNGRAIALRLDVTKPAEVVEAVRQAEAFGGIDVLVNNAGYGFMGGIEESGDEEIERQFETNFFGSLRTIRAALPAMRKRGHGFIVNISSVAGVRGFPGAGYYCATKSALESISEALKGELSSFGINCMIVEPGYFRTDFSGGSIAMTQHPHPDYPHLVRQREAAKASDGVQLGDPVRGIEAIITAMESTTPPQRLVLGSDAYAIVQNTLSDRLTELKAWQEVTESTDFPDES